MVSFLETTNLMPMLYGHVGCWKNPFSPHPLPTSMFLIVAFFVIGGGGKGRGEMPCNKNK